MARKLSMATRKELINAVKQRYCNAAHAEKRRVLDEFVALTGYHRKHAIRVLGAIPGVSALPSCRNRVYDEAGGIPDPLGSRVDGSMDTAKFTMIYVPWARHVVVIG